MSREYYNVVVMIVLYRITDHLVSVAGWDVRKPC